ncbi:casein kinase II [Thecamonas trahens ATCC 50062]|uniref:non-specific serine/threonine protein kinase n=1 Tax=Thecamonas trahens ATCC 50062 TaxID=461836 RepID=A0A0L0D2D2_THETB|nr:casein kinase II [Thecamonas trahens ATCC 50062]KNC46452.1 casein kinase II [Thecamonas trahens ATCC 50062]|eukprot:XP_013760743.1 casein kinase II [Thecamonas trahens ATCC 50062]
MSLARVYRDAISKQPDDFTAYNDMQIEWGDPEKYAVVRKIGQGKYSEVFLGKDVSTDPEGDVVLKVLKPVKFQRIKKEIKILQNLRDGPNILQLLDVVRDPETKQPCVVFEWVDAVDFKTYFPSMPDMEVRFYLYKLLEALDYAHSKGIMHRDVKPHNTVYDPKTRTLRLIDWGLADFYYPGMEFSLRVASRYFKAVELFLGMRDYDYSSDLWSVGVVAAQMVFISYPFFRGKRTDANQLSKIVRILGTDDMVAFQQKYHLSDEDSCEPKGFKHYPKKPWESFITEENKHLCSPEALSLVDGLLCYDHQERLTAREAMEHPYFAPIREAEEAGQDPF